MHYEGWFTYDWIKAGAPIHVAGLKQVFWNYLGYDYSYAYPEFWTWHRIGSISFAGISLVGFLITIFAATNEDYKRIHNDPTKIMTCVTNGKPKEWHTYWDGGSFTNHKLCGLPGSNDPQLAGIYASLVFKVRTHFNNPPLETISSDASMANIRHRLMEMYDELVPSELVDHIVEKSPAGDETKKTIKRPNPLRADSA